MNLPKVKEEILKEAMDKIDHFVPMVMTGDLTKEDIEKLLSFSLDSYALAIREEVEGLGYGNRNSGLAIGYSHAISDISSIINNSLEKR